MNTHSHWKAVSAHVGALLGRALTLTRSTDDAWDLVQDTIERALTRIPLQLPPEKMVSWLMTILRNRFIDGVRTFKPRHAPLDEDLAQPEASPEEPPLWRQFDLDDVLACLALLPARLTRAYELYTFADLSYEQIAERLHISRATVGTRVFRARNRLRSLLLTRSFEPTLNGPLQRRSVERAVAWPADHRSSSLKGPDDKAQAPAREHLHVAQVATRARPSACVAP